MSDAYSFWERLLDKYRDYFSKKVFHFYYYESHYDYFFLIYEKEYKIENRKPVYDWYYKEKTEEVDDLDYKIFKLISQNSRISALEIANKINTTAVTISNRIKKLKESDILRGFTVDIDLSKIGYYMYKVDIELKQSKGINKIIKYVEKNQYLAWFFKSIGYVDLEFGFILNNAHQLRQIMEDISNKFPDTIKNYTYFCITKTHKIFSF
jgi:DNA-binding Lrp family transcriptional regulator